MNRDLRSTVLALATSGLVIMGAAACAGESEEAFDAELRGAEGAESGSGEQTQTLSGEMEYLAPGEFIISDQAFFISEDTQILGGISACPADDGTDENGYGTVECGLEELETTLQEGTVVFAEVEMNEDGIAESITEYDQDSHLDSGDADGSGGSEDSEGGGGDQAPEEGSGGFTGTLSGELEYLAPGEYLIDGTAFYVSEDTRIIGGVYACADGVQDPDTGNVTCDFDEFDATLANGTVILAEVEIVEGIAESITEYEA